MDTISENITDIEYLKQKLEGFLSRRRKKDPAIDLARLTEMHPQTIRFLLERPGWINYYISLMDLEKQNPKYETILEKIMEYQNSAPEKLAGLWFELHQTPFENAGNMIKTDFGYRFFSKTEHEEEIKDTILTDPRLIDDPNIRHYFRSCSKEGSDILRYIDGRIFPTPRLPEQMKTAVAEDQIPVFAMMLDMFRCNITFSLLDMILKNGAVNIFKYLLENNAVQNKNVPLRELCFHIVSVYPDHISVPFLTAIADHRRGLLKNVFDPFGRNLLWYAMYNQNTIWLHPKNKLIPFLLEKGCEPENRNTFGLAWNDVLKHLTPEQKETIAKERYRKSKAHPFADILKQEQPKHELLTKG